MKLAAALALTLLLTPYAQAQTAPDPKPTPHAEYVDPRPVKTFYLVNSTASNDDNEILTALRLILEPSAKLFLASNQHSITLRGTPEQIDLAGKLIAELDRPKKSYRLNYTLRESDAGKPIGNQHAALTVAVGARGTLKSGSKVPLVTGTPSGANPQVQYIDIGLNIDSTLTELAGGGRLLTKIEASSVAPETSGIGAQDPVVRQTIVENIAVLTLLKPQIIGSVDIPGSTRHLDIEVIMEPLK